MVEVQVAPVPVAVGSDEEEEEEEERLREIEAVAEAFVCLVLEDQLGAQPMGGGKSPAALVSSPELRPSAGLSNNASEIARKLKGIGDELDVRVKKEIEEATSALLSRRSVFQVGASQFNSVCSTVLSNCSSVLRSGWEQVSAVCLTLGQLSREVHTAQPSAESAGVVTGRLNHFTRQYMTEVGLDEWIRINGGLMTLLGSETGELVVDQENPTVDLSDLAQ